MKLSTARIGAMLRKELREYRRNRQIVVTMMVLPAVFSLYPSIQLFALPDAAAGVLQGKQPLIYMLAIPAIVPAAVAAFSVAGERQQGTLEPALTTPISSEELLLGKALAALVPVLAVSYLVFGVFLACIQLFAQPVVAAAIIRWPQIAVQLAFTPLVAALSIWVGIAISTRSSDTRVAVQLSVLASTPTVVLATIISTGGIHATARLVLVLGAVLLVADVLGWRIVAPLLDRERLITGTKA